MGLFQNLSNMKALGVWVDLGIFQKGRERLGLRRAKLFKGNHAPEIFYNKGKVRAVSFSPDVRQTWDTGTTPPWKVMISENCKAGNAHNCLGRGSFSKCGLILPITLSGRIKNPESREHWLSPQKNAIVANAPSYFFHSIIFRKYTSIFFTFKSIMYNIFKEVPNQGGRILSSIFILTKSCKVTHILSFLGS